MNILLLGPLPPPLGGATVLFKQLLEEIEQDPSVSTIVIDTASKSTNWQKRIFRPFRVFLAFLIRLPKVDAISFHASLSGALKYSLLINLCARLFKKKWIFRGFGGGYADYYDNCGFFKRALLRRGMLSADICLFETQALTSYFSAIKPTAVHWYPNSRPFVGIENRKRSINSGKKLRCVFVGHVKESKGIKLLTEAIGRLQPLATLDVFGPISDEYSSKNLNSKAVSYKGEIDASEVLKVLINYDALVLPTFYEGEGYPGVILEAFSVGLPVVSTKWRSIPELVSVDSGILVNTKDRDALESALKQLQSDRKLLARLADGALERGKLFDSKKQTEKFLEMVRHLIA